MILLVDNDNQLNIFLNWKYAIKIFKLFTFFSELTLLFLIIKKLSQRSISILGIEIWYYPNYWHLAKYYFAQFIFEQGSGKQNN